MTNKGFIVTVSSDYYSYNDSFKTLKGAKGFLSRLPKKEIGTIYTSNDKDIPSVPYLWQWHRKEVF